MSDRTIRLTVDIGPDPERHNSWSATCRELGVTTTSNTPQLAFSSLATAVRHAVNSTMKKRFMTDASAGIDVMHEIAEGVRSTGSVKP